MSVEVCTRQVAIIAQIGQHKDIIQDTGCAWSKLLIAVALLCHTLVVLGLCLDLCCMCLMLIAEGKQLVVADAWCSLSQELVGY